VFLTLQGIATLFDLGFSPAVTRAAGYLWGGAKELKAFGIAQLEESENTGTKPNYELLGCLVSTMRIYYRALAIASGLIMLFGGGAWIWYKTQTLADANSLRFCYVFFVVGGFLNVTGDLWPALLSGINGVKSAQKILCGSALLNLAVTGAGLLARLDIWALTLGVIVGGIFLRQVGRRSFIRLAGRHLNSRTSVQFPLIAKIWPTAWRSGLVSLGGFFVLSANTLICSAFLDLQVTGSYGLCLNLINLLTSAASTFALIKLPLINQLRATGQTNTIVDIWIQRTRVSILVYVLGGLLLLATGNYFLELIGSKTLLLPTGQLALTVLILGLTMHHILYASLVISENQNPFVALSLFSGAGTVLFSLLLTPRFGVWGMLLAQGCVQACANNWWPVYRAIRGLGLSWSEYWRRYPRTPIRI